MRTLHLNLAAKPFRDYRAVYAVAALVAILSAFLLLSNAQTAYRYFGNTERTRAEIDRLNRQANDETRRSRQIQNDLRRLDRKALNLQARFINGQITERAFSWSQLLDQLERIVPNDVRLVSLNPWMNEAGITQLKIRCLAKSPNGLVDVLRRLQQDPHFDRPFPEAEDIQEGGLHQFTITVDYRSEPRGILP